MQKSFLSLVFLAAGLFAAAGFCQQPAQPVPNELIQYVRDARKAGEKEGQVQQNATAAGWSAEVVNGAIQAVFHPESADGAASGAPPASAREGDSAVNKAAVSPELAKPAQPDAAKAPEPGGADGGPKLPPPGTPAKPAAVDRGVPNDYEIGAGDELQISVWKEPDASVPSVVVRPDGKISLPILKEVAVVGLTPTQAEALITSQLVKFISAADVTVIVKAINSKKIYALGGVKKEGPIPYTYRMTVLQALSEAGGLTDYAKRKKIYVLRHENGRDYKLPFDYDAILMGKKMELNLPLIPGDTIVVPK